MLNSRGMLDLSTDNRDTRVLGIYICARASMCVAGETIKCRKATRVLSRIDFCTVPPAPSPPRIVYRTLYARMCTYLPLSATPVFIENCLPEQAEREESARRIS